MRAGLVFSVLAAVACGGDIVPDSSVPLTTSTVSASVEVVYEVTGSGGVERVAITVQNPRGGTQQTTVSLPYRGSFTGFQRGDFVYLSAQNQESHGAVECRVRIDGEIIYEARSVGGYAVCSVSGPI